MRRREFIMLMGGAALAGLFATALRATAQQTAKIPRVGILSPALATPFSSACLSRYDELRLEGGDETGRQSS